MLATLIARFLPYKTLIIVGVLASIILGSWLYVSNLQATNHDLKENNQILIDNNEMLNTEKSKWISAMKEQVVFSAKLEKSKSESDKSIAKLRGNLKNLRRSAEQLKESIDINSTDGDKLSKQFTNQLTNSYNCISNATGYKVGCVE